MTANSGPVNTGGSAPAGDESLANAAAKKREQLAAAASPQMRALLQQAPSEMKQPEQRLQEEKAKHPEAVALLQQIEDALVSKRYHEFTMASFAYVAPLSLGDNSLGSASIEVPSPAPSFSGLDRVEFFFYVVGPLQNKLDEAAFLRLLGAVCEDIDGRDALFFLSYYPLSDGTQSSSGSGQSRGAESSVLSPNASPSASQAPNAALAAALEAEVLYKTCQSYHLSQCQEFSESEEILDELQKKLHDTSVGVGGVAQAAFQRAAATLAKAQDKYAEFYHHAIIFLAYTPTMSIPEKDRVGLAYEIAVAALVAPDIFNFGELMQQALILSTLKTEPEHQWLWLLLEAFHCGSLPQFDAICSDYARQIQATALANHMPALRRKIATAALLRLAFTRSAAGTAAGNPEASGMGEGPAAEAPVGLSAGGAGISAASRSLSFDVIAKSCKVGEDDVERLVMRAMSQKLMRGSIDQVKRQVFVTWVRPSLLLDETGMTYLQDRLLRWIGAAEQLHQQLQNQTTELLGS
ncbi:agap001651-PA, related [Neospora caninum Liverpool]|uniref:Agap001651-PA, related n=1 Tax=Neospora caninum (strain Liverpool) TaxID=572307 RepID=F0V7T9_NEOCL|nr:agap001651-PA, related [Neospora caninum Liverpool]CBZ49780.1 agap001651-PA, related [Neospora caninum Liverpool]CEL64368.1 TPA: AGAP001651-PA, related [Neospora caninum Liverpool]|eukprot:XP_003879815.1 agap001651-PA, related [Neospora caninum Liverpool]